MVNSRQKGARAERELAELLRQHGYAGARRGQQYAGSPDSPDVVGGPPGWHLESKCREQHNPWQWMDEAEWDAGASQKPVVFIKRNRKRWLVVLRVEDFMAMVKQPDAPLNAGDLSCPLQSPVATSAPPSTTTRSAPSV